MTLYVDPPLMLFDDSVSDRQAQTCPFAYVFGGKEWLENLLLIFLRDPNALVLHVDPVVLAGLALEVVGGHPFFGFQTDLHLTPFGHGLDGIDHYIGKDLLKLSVIGLCRKWLIRGFKLDSHMLFGCQRVQKLDRCLHKFPQVDDDSITLHSKLVNPYLRMSILHSLKA